MNEKKTIEEKNRMIAKFKGCEYRPETPAMYEHWVVGEEPFLLSELKFHTSWDWIIPVIKEVKLSRISSNDNGYEIIDRIDNSLMECDIDSLHSHLYDFIEWYNQNK